MTHHEVPHKWNQGDRQRGLMAVVLVGYKRASLETGIPKDTLSDWKLRYPEEWAKARAEAESHWRQRVAAEMEDLVDRYTAAEQAALDKLLQELPDAGPKEVGLIVAALAKAQSLASDQVAKMRDRPTPPQQQVPLEKLEAAIARLLPKSVDSTAEEEDGS